MRIFRAFLVLAIIAISSHSGMSADCNFQENAKPDLYELGKSKDLEDRVRLRKECLLLMNHSFSAREVDYFEKVAFYSKKHNLPAFKFLNEVFSTYVKNYSSNYFSYAVRRFFENPKVLSDMCNRPDTSEAVSKGFSLLQDDASRMRLKDS